MEKRWKILKSDSAIVHKLSTELGINPVLCNILVQRNVCNYEQAKNYFRPQHTQFHSPWLMKDMRKAVDRIILAMQQREKILVFGDYDVDGTTSVACMFQFLKKIYEVDKLDFYIPHRYNEGYGVSKKGIDFAHEHHFHLIISLDCGIKSVELVSYAKSLGIDFIICDHHLPDNILPDAVAILNPKQLDCHYPYKELCGCGVGFKLITALTETIGLEGNEHFEFLDLLATAIAADIVPLNGENRALAYFGLKKANENPNNGIKALKHLSKLETEIHITNLVFMIAPRVNAAGRMDDARKAVLMFVANSYEDAMHYAELLHLDNIDRREADLSITEEALSIIQNDQFLINKNSTVVFQPHWHKGVVGIVASRLIDHYYRPTIVLTKSGDVLAGSARSVNGFNLYEAVHACKDHLLGYGGHFAAAGMTLLPDQLDAFIQKFEEIVAATLPPELTTPELVIDAEITFKDISATFYKIICQMEPFGPENLRPLFIAKNVRDNGWSKIVKEQHIRFSLIQNNILFTGIGFGLAHKFTLLQMQQPVDIVFTLDENEWNGNKHLQLKIIDLRLSQSN